MKMTSICFIVLSLFCFVQFSESTEFVSSCESNVCLAKPFNLTCEIKDGNNTGIMFVHAGKTIEVACTADNVCIVQDPAYTLLEHSASRIVVSIGSIEASQGGVWSCYDEESNTHESNCDVSVYEPPVVSQLEAHCEESGDPDQPLTVWCTGVSELGVPSSILSITLEDGTNTIVEADMSYNMSKYGLIGRNITCSLGGDAVMCVKDHTTSDSTTCPGVMEATTPAVITDNGRASKPRVGLIVGVLLLVLILVVVIIDLLLCRFKEIGFFYFLQSKIGRKGKAVIVQESDSKEGEVDLEKSAPEKKPLLEGKADDTVTSIIVEDTDPKVKGELEPEDKDPEVSPIMEEVKDDAVVSEEDKETTEGGKEDK